MDGNICMYALFYSVSMCMTTPRRVPCLINLPSSCTCICKNNVCSNVSADGQNATKCRVLCFSVIHRRF